MLLETDLNALFAPEITFIASSPDFPGLEHCLWDGFVAAAAQHPFVARAIEELIYLNQSRDANDVQRLACSHSTATELWKIRLGSVDEAMWGSCLLGRSVHRALGSKSLLGDYHPGRIVEPEANEERGESLILLVRTPNMMHACSRPCPPSSCVPSDE